MKAASIALPNWPSSPPCHRPAPIGTLLRCCWFCSRSRTSSASESCRARGNHHHRGLHVEDTTRAWLWVVHKIDARHRQPGPHPLPISPFASPELVEGRGLLLGTRANQQWFDSGRRGGRIVDRRKNFATRWPKLQVGVTTRKCSECAPSGTWSEFRPRIEIPGAARIASARFCRR